MENKIASLEYRIARLEYLLASEKKFKQPRKWDKKHCLSKSCDDMGFSEKASCRPYKNCYQ